MFELRIKNMYGSISGIAVFNHHEMHQIGHQISLGPYSQEALLGDALCVVEDNFTSVGYVSNIRIEPEHRGEGHGSKLFNDFFERHLKQTEVDLLVALTDHPQIVGFDLLAFYQRRGFEVVFSEGGEVLMANKGKAALIREQLGLSGEHVCNPSCPLPSMHKMRM